MKIINIMNFVRQCDPRMEDSERILYETTAAEVALVKEYGLDSTFLLQYDAAIDPGYQELFRREADSHMELGLWYEIVQPLTQKAGIPWRGREGWPWDWHVIPGFSMAYTVEERKKLIDIAMEDFRAIFGEYPKTVASWLLDSYTVNYLADNYPVKAFAICRDQTNTDAYTLVGGYFNQAYYPSRRSMFTPAQSAEQQVNVPMFRLLGPDPIHNYDGERYMTNEKYLPYHGCCTLEPIWESGSNPEIVDWFFRNYFRNEDLGFSYAQLGQENSFGPDLLPGLRMQFEKLKSWPDLCVWKMGETGEWFRKTYPDGTPATSVSALDDWDGTDRIQSVYYDCKNYVANLFRCDGKVFLRCLYCFDEDAPERYLDRPCETWDATYENLPVVDTGGKPGACTGSPGHAGLRGKGRGWVSDRVLGGQTGNLHGRGHPNQRHPGTVPRCKGLSGTAKLPRGPNLLPLWGTGICALRGRRNRRPKRQRLPDSFFR